MPVGVAILWRNQERDPEPAPPADPALRTLRVLSAVLGVLLVAGAALLFAVPVRAGEHLAVLAAVLALSLHALARSRAHVRHL